jgi:hypothetical protein
MSRAYNCTDADGHILEPLELWAQYMDPKYRYHAPRLVRDGAVVVDDAAEYKDGRKGGFDPQAHIPDMDLDRVDAAYLYPSIGLFPGAVDDPDISASICRAYNRWLADYRRPYPDGFFPGAPDMVREKLVGLSANTVQQEMAGGARGFYGLN